MVGQPRTLVLRQRLTRHRGTVREGRFVGNPYLLVGVDQRVAYNFTETGKAPESLLPVVQSITFDRTALRGASRYEVASHFDGVTTRLSTHERPAGITIVAYNARDFGLPFLAVDVTRSQAIRPVAPGVVKIPQYIHRGNSCGYAGGCNNMSPKSDAMDIDVERLPARIVIKLWRQEPTASSDPPNVWWTIDLE